MSNSGAHKHTPDHDGEPGCQTLEEVNMMFRNFWDPTTYWKCETLGQPAKLLRCPQSQLFKDAEHKCVQYTEWHWSEPTEPPSRPASAKSRTARMQPPSK